MIGFVKCPECGRAVGVKTSVHLPPGTVRPAGHIRPEDKGKKTAERCDGQYALIPVEQMVESRDQII